MKNFHCRLSVYVAVWVFVGVGMLQVFFACGSPNPQSRNIQAEQKIEQQLAHLASLRYIDDIVKARKLVADSIDVHALQASPLRDQLLHTWLHLYAYDVDLLPDAREMIGRTQQDTTGVVRKPLVQAICMALLEDGREEAATILAAYSRGYAIEQGAQSEIAARMLRQVTLPGQPAPHIEGLDTNDQQLASEQPAGQLVVFYESDCGTCLLMLEELKQRYPELKAQGVRVISISVDNAPEVHQGLASTLPWPDKLCDFRGFYGENPTRWGVSATPVIYQVNNQGIVTGWGEDLNEIAESIKT